MKKEHCQCTYQSEKQVLTVLLLGEIDHHRAVAVRCEIDDKIYETKPKKTVLDLSKIDFMDSSGLGLIMGRLALMQKIGGELSIKKPNARVQRILELSGIGRMIGIEEEEK